MKLQIILRTSIAILLGFLTFMAFLFIGDLAKSDIFGWLAFFGVGGVLFIILVGMGTITIAYTIYTLIWLAALHNHASTTKRDSSNKETIFLP